MGTDFQVISTYTDTHSLSKYSKYAYCVYICMKHMCAYIYLKYIFICVCIIYICVYIIKLAYDWILHISNWNHLPPVTSRKILWAGGEKDWFPFMKEFIQNLLTEEVMETISHF